jgi:hypothetical protein
MDLGTSSAALFGGLPADWPILILVAAILSLESFSSGSTRTNAISIAFPITSTLFWWLPSTFLAAAVMSQLTTTPALSAIFGLLFIGIYFVIHRMIFSFGSSGGDVPQAMISGIATTIIIVVFWLQTPGLSDLWRFGDQVQLVFNESVRAWWLIGALATLAYTRG